MKLARVLLISVLAAGAACGGSSTPAPTSPAAPASTTVTYGGQYRITACGSLCGYVGPNWPFTISITKQGDARSAVLRTEPWGLEATLTGTEQTGGAIVFKGEAPAVSPMVTGADFDLVVQEGPGGTLSGTFSYLARRSSQPNLSFTAEITSAAITIPAAPAQDFAGTWVTSGRHERLCTSDWGCFDPSLGIILVRQGSGYLGLAQIQTSGTQRLSIAVSGTVQNGALVLTGSIPKSPGQLLDIGQQIPRLALRILPSGELAGDYEIIESQGNISYGSRGALLAGARRPNAPTGTFTGEWYGWMLHDSCVGISSDCSVIHSSNFLIRLTQSGASVTGEYAGQFPMTGTASGSSLVLEGSRTRPDCVTKAGAPCRESLRFNITGMDEWGMLTGTASHSYSSKFSDFTKAGRMWNYSRRIK